MPQPLGPTMQSDFVVAHLEGELAERDDGAVEKQLARVGGDDDRRCRLLGGHCDTFGNKFLLSLPGNCVMPLGAVKAATFSPMERRRDLK